MPKYLITASYNAEGSQGLLRDGGSNRVTAVSNAIESVGGQVESFYFAFGDADAYVIADFPSEVAVAAIALKVGASGLVNMSTTALLTPEQVDAACDQSAALEYKAPGK